MSAMCEVRVRSLIMIILAVMSLSFAGAAEAQAQTPRLKVRGQLQYVHGVNLAWMFGRHSTDIGYNPLHPEWGNGYNSNTAANWLMDIRRMKVNVVRLWLFEDLEGLEFDASGHVLRLQPQFLVNLDDLMLRANALGLAYELVLVTHTLNQAFGKTLPSGAVVRNFVTDPVARQKFIANAVTPLANRYRLNAAVFSFDVMNESDLGVSLGVCSQAQLRTFVSQVAAGIHAENPATQVTCSCAWYKFNTVAEHNSWYGGLGLDFYENHNYATTPNLKVVPAWLDRPLLLGEYGPDLPAPHFTGQFWTEADQNASAAAHLTQAMNRGWAGSLAWIYFHSNGNGENLARIPGGVQNWEPAGTTIRDFGTRLFESPKPLRVFRENLLAGWSNWSWGGIVNFSFMGIAYGGTTSIQMNSTAGFSGLSLRSGTAVAAAPYSSIRFAVSTPGAIRPFQVYIQTTDNGPASSAFVFSSAANGWKVVNVPLSALGNPAVIKRITVQSMSPGAIGVHYYDNIELLP